MPGALEGIKVLDLTRYAAGPVCTCILGELGAEIFKVEEPREGEAQRAIPPLIGGMGYTFHIVNHDKKSLTLNLKHTKGKEIFKQLAQKVDIVIENFSPGVMDSFGLGYKDLQPINPGLIYASVSGFGQTGPYRSKVSYDMVIQAMSGIMSVTGFPDKPPVKTGPAVVDIITSLYTTIAVLAALHYRHLTGKGQYIDMGMFDVAWATMCLEFLPRFAVYGEIIPRMGNRHPNVAPYNCYRTADDYVVIATANDNQWEALLKVMGKSELKEDPRFNNLSQRVKNMDLVDGMVEEWTKDKTTAEVLTQLEAAHIPCAPVATIDKVINDPQLKERKMILDINQDEVKLTLPASVFKLSQTPGRITSLAPRLGEHTEEILTHFLNYSTVEIQQLREEGII